MGGDKEPGVEACGEVDTCRDMGCPHIPVMMMCQKHKVVMMHKVGDAEAVLFVKRLI